MRIEVLRVSTARPFNPVNVYLLMGEENILIDVGPRQGVAYSSLHRELGRLGLKFRDIDVILITHGHVDHWGLLRRVQEAGAGGAYIHESDLDRLTGYEEYIERYLTPFVRDRELYGFPQGVDAVVERYRRYLASFTEPPVEIEGFRNLVYPVGDGVIRAIHTPGHSDGSVVYIYGGYGFSGDLVLKGRIPVITDLRSYIRSLREVMELGTLSTLHPGHGPPVTDVASEVIRMMEAVSRGLNSVMAALASPKTVYGLMTTVFGETRLEDPRSTIVFVVKLRQTLSYINYLSELGMVEGRERGGKLVYRCVGCRSLDPSSLIHL